MSDDTSGRSPESGNDPAPAPDHTARPDGADSSPMGVVLRLPPVRGRSWLQAAPIEPAGGGSDSSADRGIAGPDERAAGAASGADRPTGPDLTIAGPEGLRGGLTVAARRTRGLHAADPDDPADRADWPWVEEWRAGGEPTPWATGLGLTTFVALVVGVAVWVLAAGLSDRPAIAIGVNLLVAAGLAPAIWLSRGLPVLRWIGAGAAAGIVVGWLSALLMLPLPAP